MKTLLSCEFNLDTACVELRYTDGSMISIDCTAVENEFADNLYQRSELDYLIRNRVQIFRLSKSAGTCNQTMLVPADILTITLVLLRLMVC